MNATKLNIYLLIHRTLVLKDITRMISDYLDEIGFDFNIILVQSLKKRFDDVKIGIGKFADIPVYPFVALQQQSTSKYVFVSHRQFLCIYMIFGMHYCPS
ncbi:hypothetical protein RF11_14211 [Thelohanellus kitauei]|uniref:Uncharacterized protein n=1 Tax=Thelohanellus kitauei TaxID=669202 RepID=A0A0C2MGL1_THEKT|nr:hypothetical protein RF11_14211 [Thelohanellus kitauei]